MANDGKSVETSEPKKPVFRVIGDSHGHYDDFVRKTWAGEQMPVKGYKSLIKEAEHTVQIGDLGYDYSPMHNVDPERHKVVLGNHESYNQLPPHSLGDYGVYTVPGFGDIFFVRGAFSIDHVYRTYGVDVFVEEELTMHQGYEALEVYKEVKPDFMITHDAPLSVVPPREGRGPGDVGKLPLPPMNNMWMDLRPSRTQYLLQAMFEAHQPKQWIFGHYHVSWDEVVNGTRFICLNELEYIDFEKPS